jgi:hypothetical protein
MFAKTIIDSDVFLDMPLSTQALYFHLSMRADDEGFINNPRKIQRMVGASDDDLRILISKRFIITFDSGIVVIKHWRIHNYIQNDRFKPTAYTEEREMLSIKPNKAYTLDKTVMDTKCIQDVSKMDIQYRLGKDRLGKDSIDKFKEISSNEDIKKNASDDADILPEAENVNESFDDINEYVDERPVEKPKPKRKVFKPPTVEEVKAYAVEKGFTRLNAESFVAYYESKGWMIGRNKMKNWKAAASGWESREKNYNQQSRARPSNFNQFKGREQTEEQARELERKLLGGVT